MGGRVSISDQASSSALLDVVDQRAGQDGLLIGKHEVEHSRRLGELETEVLTQLFALGIQPLKIPFDWPDGGAGVAEVERAPLGKRRVVPQVVFGVGPALGEAHRRRLEAEHVEQVGERVARRVDVPDLLGHDLPVFLGLLQNRIQPDEKRRQVAVDPAVDLPLLERAGYEDAVRLIADANRRQRAAGLDVLEKELPEVADHRLVELEQLFEKIAKGGRPERPVHRFGLGHVAVAGVFEEGQRRRPDTDCLGEALRVGLFQVHVGLLEIGRSGLDGKAAFRTGVAAVEARAACRGVVGRSALGDEAHRVRRVVVVVDQGFDRRGVVCGAG